MGLRQENETSQDKRGGFVRGGRIVVPKRRARTISVQNFLAVAATAAVVALLDWWFIGGHPAAALAFGQWLSSN